MARKQFKLTRKMLIVWLTLGGFILLLAPQKVTSRAHLAFARTFQWPLSVGRTVSLKAKTDERMSAQSDDRDMAELRAHLQNVIEQRDQLQRELDRLTIIKEIPQWKRAAFSLADIITMTRGGDDELFINRGTDDGLRAGQFVLADNSIVGTVSQVSTKTAKVKLITSAESRMAVRIAGSDAGRLMVGTGDKTAKIQLLKEKVAVGTPVVAVPRHGFLDCAMTTGVVTGCTRNVKSPLLWDATVEPACDITKVTAVAVIVTYTND